MLEQKSADLVDDRGALANQPAAHAMHRLQVQLLGALHRHEAHGWARHGLGDRLGIAIVVLVPPQERLDVLGWEQTDIVTKCR